MKAEYSDSLRIVVDPASRGEWEYGLIGLLEQSRTYEWSKLHINFQFNTFTALQLRRSQSFPKTAPQIWVIRGRGSAVARTLYGGAST